MNKQTFLEQLSSMTPEEMHKFIEESSIKKRKLIEVVSLVTSSVDNK